MEQGQWLMMMGSAGEFPQTPEKEPVFVEDLPEEDQEHAALVWIRPFSFWLFIASWTKLALNFAGPHSWTLKFRKYMSHEFYYTVLKLSSRTKECIDKVGSIIYLAPTAFCFVVNHRVFILLVSQCTVRWLETVQYYEAFCIFWKNVDATCHKSCQSFENNSLKCRKCWQVKSLSINLKYNLGNVLSFVSVFCCVCIPCDHGLMMHCYMDFMTSWIISMFWCDSGI